MKSGSSTHQLQNARRLLFSLKTGIELVGEMRKERVYLRGDLANQEVHACLLDPSDPLGGERGETDADKYRGHPSPPVTLCPHSQGTGKCCPLGKPEGQEGKTTPYPLQLQHFRTRAPTWPN